MKTLLMHYKSTIISVISALSVFALGKWYIDQTTMELISALLVTIWGWINIALSKK